MEFSDIFYRVTRKHWPPIRGPPLRTGSTDYLRTGPRTTPTDHPQNRIKKQKERGSTWCKTSLTASPIHHSCRRNLERYAEKNITDLSSVSGVSLSLYIAISFAVTWKTGKTLRSLEICAALSTFYPPFCSAHSPACFVNSSQPSQFAYKQVRAT